MGLFDRFKKDKAPDPIKTLDMRGHKNSKTDKIISSYVQAGVNGVNVLLNDNQRTVLTEMLCEPVTGKAIHTVTQMNDEVLSHILEHIDKAIADHEDTSIAWTELSRSRQMTIDNLTRWYETIETIKATKSSAVPGYGNWNPF